MNSWLSFRDWVHAQRGISSINNKEISQARTFEMTVIRVISFN
ncbi:hypothetical protein ABTF50_20625 [Acinetobacter baumannii]